MSIIRTFQLFGAAALFVFFFSTFSLSRAAILDDPSHPEPVLQDEGDDGDAEADADEADAEDEDEEGLTLEATRNISFETNEGTWISLDVSPDGSTIIFELLGDIYTLPIAGGEATNLLSGMAFESQPVYSPDGTKIAFISDRDGSEEVWISNADGSDPKKVSSGGASGFKSPSWSADGDYVYASRVTAAGGANQITMYHVDGGSGIDITTPGTPDTPRDNRLNAMGAVESPDGRYLYYATRFRNFSYNVTLPLWRIMRRDFETGDVDPMVTAQGSAMKPVLSPDGSQLVYGTRFEQQTGLRIRDLHSGADRWLVYPITRDEQESIANRDTLPNYAFTPDGESLIVTIGGGIKSVDVATGVVSDIPFTAQVNQDLGPRLHFAQVEETGPVKARLIQSPMQSPDGTRLAFSAFARIYVTDLDGGTPAPLTGDDVPEFQPVWSPDGTWIAYVSWTANGGGHIWRKRADGTGSAEQLTEVAAFYSEPTYSPDGQTIVALRAGNHERVESGFDFGGLAGLDLIKLDADGGNVRLIMPSRGVGTPHFGRDNDRVNVYSREGLLSVRLDGTDRKNLLAIMDPPNPRAAQPSAVNDARISPDGNWALAYAMNQLFVTAVPHIGGDAPTVMVAGPSLPTKQLTDIGADYFGWADDGETITWAIGSTYYRMALADISFEPDEEEEAEEGEDTGGDGDDDAGEGGDDTDADNEAGVADDGEADEEDAPIEAMELTNENVEAFEIVVEMARDTGGGTVLLQGGRVITMNGDTVIENGDVLVVDNRIAAVGASGTLDVPAGADIMDMSGKTIVPGYVDTHAHWFEIRRGIMDVGHWSFLANVAYGVTAGLDVQTATNDMFAYQDLIDAGQMIGLRAYSTGPGVFWDTDFSSKAQAYNRLRRYRDHYRTRNIKSYIVGNRKQRQWVVEASFELGMMPTTEGGLDLKLDLTHVIDGMSGNEHSLPVVPLYRDVVELHARSLTSYTPTLLVAYGGPWGENWYYAQDNVHDDEKLNRFTPHGILDSKTLRRNAGWFSAREYHVSDVAESATRMLRAGGLIGVGSHGQLQGLGYHWELWLVASGGMTPMEALRTATINGATIIGRENEIGSLEVGKFADLVILNSNPLDDIHNTVDIDQVMQNGRIYDGDTMDQVWPNPMPLETQWWWNSAPE